jgi:molybdopterin-guanine dinucleotide biosynthesis protein A
LNTFTGVILAGGKSSRMGQDKSALLFKGNSFLHHCKRLFIETGASDIIVSANNKAGVPDIYPNCGPLSGIHAALQQTSHSLLIMPVDMPLLTCEQLTPLVTHTQRTTEALYYERFPLPLFLANTEKVRHILSNILEKKDNLSIRSLIAQLEHEKLPVNNSHFFSNVNTMDDYKSIVVD